MSNQQSLQQFFASKLFEIPKYQRSYAWEKQNIGDLFEDIQEAIKTNTNHYIGTVVLAETGRHRIFNIVDGQQRITTIVMFISVIINELQEGDRVFYRRYYIKENDQFKLKPLERDKDFFFQLLEGVSTVNPESKSQRYMLEAYQEMQTIVTKHIADHLQFLKAIEALSVLEFIEESESNAIRIFQTVNDRGKLLSRMDKMKSLLFYFSNKYLSEKYDHAINDKFGEIFELYDDIKLIGEEQEINIISSKQFNEDDLLRHHHISFSEVSYDPTGQQVFDEVKSKLSYFRNNENFKSLGAYIEKYLNSLLEYVRAFGRIISKTKDNADYYKLFSILGLSAVYYPVITQLEKQSFLEQELPTAGISVLKMVEMIDVRMLKVRKYAGKKYIAEFAYCLNEDAINEDTIEDIGDEEGDKEWTIEDVESRLLSFNSFEMSDERFKDALSTQNYYTQTGLLRMLFIDYCERLENKSYSIEELKNIMSTEPTIEHILSQCPNFAPTAYGFKKNEEDFEDHKNLLGNLTLLEKKINSSIKNDDLVEKLKGYGKSRFRMTSQLATSLATTQGNFKKTHLQARGKQLVDDFVKRWWAEPVE